jgi:hypothetical protein
LLEEVIDVRYLVLVLVAFGATFLLKLFWNALGVGLSYWDTAPLGFTSVLLFGVMASLMSVGVDPQDDAPEPLTTPVVSSRAATSRIGQGFQAWDVRSASTTVPPTQPQPETSSPACD